MNQSCYLSTKNVHDIFHLKIKLSFHLFFIMRKLDDKFTRTRRNDKFTHLKSSRFSNKFKEKEIKSHDLI